MHILLTGGTGWIGRALCAELGREGHSLTVLSRRPEAVPAVCGKGVRGLGDLRALRQEPPVDAVVNLAGAPVADWPWTGARRRVLRASRVDLTRDLVAALADLSQPPALLVSASAVGYYGDAGELELDEDSAVMGSDFGSRLCRDWELEARSAEALGMRVARVRIGLVLGPGGGLLQRLALPARLGLGARLGSGEQWQSWVHRDDVVGLLRWLLACSDSAGVYHATAPEPVRQAEFNRALSACFGRRPRLIVPASLLRLGLGEMSVLLLGGQKALPRRTEAQGFRFHYRHLNAALAAIYPDRPAA